MPLAPRIARIVTRALVLLLCAAPLQALTVAEVTAIHDARAEPYALRSFPIDDATRRQVEENLAFLDPALRRDVILALNDRFDGGAIHVYQQTDTSLVSNIVAVELDGQVVLLHIESVAFFERPDIVARRVALFDAILAAFDGAPFPGGWTATAFADATDAALAYGDGDRSTAYPGWVHATPPGYQTLGVALVPDWIGVTVTTITDCPPRYPQDGWMVVFLCNGT